MVPPARCSHGLHWLLHSPGHLVSPCTHTLIPLRKVHNCDSKCLFRGAGCIFIEMLQGSPAFPGVADVFEQLLKIWTVSLYCNCVKVLFYPFIYPPLLPLFISSFLLRSSGSRPRTAGQVSVICRTTNQVCAKSFFHLSLYCNLTDVSAMRGDFLSQQICLIHQMLVSVSVRVC